jgi:Domain of unknown function (DUF5679)
MAKKNFSPCPAKEDSRLEGENVWLRRQESALALRKVGPIREARNAVLLSLPVQRSKREEGRGVEGYCVKCRAKKEIKDAKSITMKNGRPATEGVCPTCGTKIFKIGKSS